MKKGFETIFVTGATGKIGSYLCELAEESRVDNFGIHLFVRDPSKLKSFKPYFKIFKGDLTDEKAIKRAMAGCTKVFLVIGGKSCIDSALENNAIKVAKQLKISHIIKISGGNAVTYAGTTSTVGQAHFRNETAIMKSGLDFDIIRPAFFSQNIFRQFLSKNFVCPDSFDMAYIDYRDLARYGWCLLQAAPLNRIHHLSGQKLVSPQQVVSVINRVLGQKLEVVNKPIEWFVTNVPDWYSSHVKLVLEKVAEGTYSVLTNDYEKLMGCPPISFEDTMNLDKKKLAWSVDQNKALWGHDK